MLPEGRLRQAVSNAAGVNEKREFFLIARIGTEDLPGATTVTPVDVADGSVLEHPEIEPAIEESDEDPLLKFSLAGVQLKYSVTYEPDRGLTVPAQGQAGNCIVKLPDGRPGFEGVPEAECGSLELARRSGIAVPKTQLVEVAEIVGLPDAVVASARGKALAVERFDRVGASGRIHAEELAQVLDVPAGQENFKYQRASLDIS